MSVIRPLGSLASSFEINLLKKNCCFRGSLWISCSLRCSLCLEDLQMESKMQVGDVEGMALGVRETETSQRSAYKSLLSHSLPPEVCRPENIPLYWTNTYQPIFSRI